MGSSFLSHQKVKAWCFLAPRWAWIESFTVGGQVIVSPTLMQAAGRGLILGDEVEVHEVIRPIDESGHRYLLRFTSVPPGVRARLDRLAVR